MRAIDILNKHKLSRTACREGILEVVISAEKALSENEIRERLSGDYDRTTFYRSFKTLEANRVIHKIVVDNQLIKYELDKAITKRKEHPHFYCNSCKGVQCLDAAEIIVPVLPPGYKAQGLDLIIKGECSVCTAKNMRE